MNLKNSLCISAMALALAACDLEGDDGQDGAQGADSSASLAQLTQIGRYTDDNNGFAESAAEIVAFDVASQRLFIVNAEAGEIDVVDLSDPTAPTKISTINATANWVDAGEINSVAVKDGVVAAAVEHDTSTSNGMLQLYNASDLAFLGQVEVGALPDMVAITQDGLTAVVANEGEPNSDYSIDPEGSITVVDISNTASPVASQVSFSAFNEGEARAAELPEDVRVFGNFGRTELTVSAFSDSDPATITVNDTSGISVGNWFTLASSEGDPLAYQVDAIAGNVLTLTDEFDGDSEVGDAGVAGLTVYLHDGQSSVAQDLEPEYIAISPDGEKAWVTLQENNAIAVIDIASAGVDKIIALGVKDHNIPGNELDASDRDDGINIRSWPVKGMYMPDSIASFEVGGNSYYITANEGDSREYDAFVEEKRFKDVPKDSDITDLDIFGLDAFEENEFLGRLLTTLTNDTDGDGDIDVPHTFGARSFSIWNADGDLVADSGNDFEVITANILGEDFNNNNDENVGDTRSDAKGPEPEAVAVGTVNGRTYAFVGLERTGGIMVYDVSNPFNPSFVQYTTNRDFSFDIEGDIDDGDMPAHVAGDLGPEGMIFVTAEDSPNGMPLVIVGNEVSGSTTIYQVD